MSETYPPENDRRSPTEIDRLCDRLAAQDKMLAELHALLVAHISEEKDIGPALRELVGLWRASKLLGVIATAVAGAAASTWAAWSWMKDHVKIS